MTKAFKFYSFLMVSLSFALLLLSPAYLLGQITNVTNDQSTPSPGAGHDYIRMGVETVNPANGSVSIRIGVPVPPGRRIILPFAFAYDSNGVHHPTSSSNGNVQWSSDTTFLSEGGWSYSVPMLSAASKTVTYTYGNNQQQACKFWTDFLFADPSGGRHALGLSAWDAAYVYQCTNFGGPNRPYNSLHAGDDHYQAIMPNPTNQAGSPAPVMIADQDGTIYDFTGVGWYGQGPSAMPDYVEDRNGNKITIPDNSNGAFTITDTLLRPAVESSGFGSSGNTVSVDGLGGNYTLDWGTATSSYAVGPQQQTNDPNCTFGNEGGSTPVVTSINLPDGESYGFSYESTYGLLEQMTYPSGGWVKYTWGLNAQSEYGAFTDYLGQAGACQYIYGAPVVIERQVSFNGSAVALDQTFAYSTTWAGNAWSQKKTTVTTIDKLRNQTYTTYYTYGPISVYPAPNDVNYFSQQVPVETQVVTNDWTGSLLSTVTKTWQDQYLMTQQRTTPAGGRTAETDYLYGGPWFPMLTDEKDYDYAASPPGSLLKHTSISYWTASSSPLFGFGGTYYQTIYDRPSSVTITGGGITAQTTYAYDAGTLAGLTATNHDDTNYKASYTNRGNGTSKSESTGSGSLSWNYSYDETGQELSVADPKSNSTTFSYSDNFQACGSPSASTNAYLTQIKDAKGFTQNFTYRYCDGQLNTAADRNGPSATITYAYADSLARLTSITYPDGGYTQYSYDNFCSPPSGTSILLQGGSYYTETANLDSVCHVTQTAITSDPNPDYTDTTYDGMGRVWTVSNPYRSKAESTYGLTTTTYDALGRVSNEGSTSSIVYPDGGSVSTVIAANCTTVTDPAGKVRQTCTDGLGRLTQVQDPTGLTTYGYDAMNNLWTVTQGSETRSFVYDSMSRLTSATNPESVGTSYTYSIPSAICSGDPSAACSRTDNRGVITNYAYNDPLNRLTGKTYQNDPANTPPASYSYDQTLVQIGNWTSPSLINPLGRLTSATTSSGGTVQTGVAYSYDSMGRPTSYWQCTPLNCGNSMWLLGYSYDLAGDVLQVTHPAGYTITNTISPARQITQVSSTRNDSTHPGILAQNITYKPWGGLWNLTDGCAPAGSCAQVQETYSYNNRMQLTGIQVQNTSNQSNYYTLAYNYIWPGGQLPPGCSAPAQGSGNNGNVMGYTYTDGVNSNLSHTAVYAYDGVNRLACSNATGSLAYNLDYSYDAFGNMSCVINQYTDGNCTASTFNNGANRIDQYSYDAAGDVTGDPFNNYGWDAEGRMATVDGGTSEIATYNALGQQARLNEPDNGYSWDQLYDLSGHWLGMYALGAWNVGGIFWLGNRGFASYDDYGNTTYFGHGNLLQSAQITTGAAGNAAGDTLFYPWGINILGGTPSGFSDFMYEDNTDWLLHTQYRQYTTGGGRWMSPDPAGVNAGNLSDPQTWNMYAYAGNNPTTNTDSTGELYCGSTNDNGEMPCVLDQEYFNNPDQYQGYKYYQSDYPQEQNEPNGQQEAGAQSPDLDPIDLGLLAYGGASIVRGVADVGANLVNIVRGAFTSETPVIQTLGIASLWASADEVVNRAVATVGNQSMRVASKDVAEAAAEKFAGPGKLPALDRNTRQIVGWKSPDGTKVVIGTQVYAQGPHYNLRNLTTGGNLHVRW